MGILDKIGKKTSDAKEKPAAVPEAPPVEAKKTGTKQPEILPITVRGFGGLMSAKGFERGSTTLISGGAGAAKTTFCLQSLYHGLKNNPAEKAIYISTEEDVGKLKTHMLINYNWDFFALEKQGRIAFLQLDPIEIARGIEAAIFRQKKKLEIDFKEFDLPFRPDRVVLDSLSSLSIAFENTDNYRKYLRHLIKKFESYNSVNLMISETEQDPSVYSRAGIEEFLVDAVIVLYNIKSDSARQTAIEILKLRSSKHVKKVVPFEINSEGIEIFPNQELFNSKF